MYTILLFYKYTDISDPEELRLEQLTLCHNLNLLGRGIVSKEGVNFTLEGEDKDIKKYIEKVKEDDRFTDIDFKTSPGTGDSFPRLSVKVRPEIVSTHLGDDDLDPNESTGEHISPEDLNDLYEEGQEFYIIDMRNDYEQKVGMFRNSVKSGMRNFRDLPETAKELEHLKDKKVVTVCTGGVRCEKASGYLKNKGFKDVSQLNGGMHRYLEKYGHKDFEGSLYVFDGRVTVNFDDGEHKVIGRCDLCGVHSEDYADCANLKCHKHFICCDGCRDEEGNAFCSKECQEVCKKVGDKEEVGV